MYNTASPENGDVKVREAPPVVTPVPATVPFAGLNHSYDNCPIADVRLTVTLPLLNGRYTRYSDPSFTKQYCVEQVLVLVRGVIPARSIRLA